MRRRASTVFAATVIILSACQRAPAPGAVPSVATTPTEPVESQVVERFRLYKTQNMFTFLLLDTRDGRIWQLQYAVGDKAVRGTVPLSAEVLGNGPEGRFELTATDNMWNFILLDTIDGRTWQCQFALDANNRGCIPIDGPHQSG